MQRGSRQTTDTGQEDDEQQDSVDHLLVGGDRDEATGAHETQRTPPHSVPQSRRPACGRSIKTVKQGKKNVFFHSR